MATYSEMLKQANEMMAQAEQKRREELAEVVAGIRAKMREYGITIEDLGRVAVDRKPGATKSKAPAKYRGPNGQLWSGGPGRKPEWAKAALASGQGLDQFLI